MRRSVVVMALVVAAAAAGAWRWPAPATGTTNAPQAVLRTEGVDIAIGPFPKRGDQPANVIVRDNAGNYIQLFGR